MNDKSTVPTRHQDCYLLPSGFSLDLLAPILEKQFHCSLEPVGKYRKVFYDTFDWRLYRQGMVLTSLQEGTKQKLSLENLSDGQVKAVAPLAGSGQTLPGLDVMPSALRNAIAPVIAMRALLPVVELCGDLQKLMLRNKHDKLVMRLVVEQDSVVKDLDGQSHVLPGRIILQPVRGFPTAPAQVRRVLENQPGLEPCRLSLLDMALQITGRHACDYSSKMKLKIDPESESDQAVKKILQHLLSAMETNEPGMLENLDSEFLHDYRVAVRRIRSILSQMKTAIPENEFSFFKAEFAWLGEVTTPARDLDVYLLEFENLQLHLQPDMRDALLPFRDFIQAQLQQAYTDLNKAIHSVRYKKLKQRLTKFINSKIRQQVVAPDAKKTIHSQSDKRIWRCYSRVVREAERLTPVSPADDYHELRKSCKKLRYLLEFFQYLYPEKEIAQLIQQLKLLQDNLGEFQDMDVQSIALRHYAKMMAEQGINNADTFMVMGILANGMEQKKIELKNAFGKCYEKFSRKKYQQLFARLFKPKAKHA